MHANDGLCMQGDARLLYQVGGGSSVAAVSVELLLKTRRGESRAVSAEQDCGLR